MILTLKLATRFTADTKRGAEDLAREFMRDFRNGEID